MQMPSPKTIPSLTGVRFLAVTMIFLLHYAYRISGDYFARGILDQLYLGVQVFFVLSGFVICYKYYEASRLNRSFLLLYYLRRFARIYPLFFLLTTATYILLFIKTTGGAQLWKEYFLNITFLKGFSEKYYLTGIGPSWSLTVEECFYFLAPVIFLFIKRKKILFLQVPFWWAVGGILLMLFSLFPFEGFFGSAYFVFFTTFFGRCFEFYLGISLALHFLGHIKRRLPHFSYPVYTIVGLCWMGTIILALYANQRYQEGGAYQVSKILLSNLFFPPGVFLFFWGLIREASWIRRLFSSRLFQLLGKSSYAFFLVHTGFIATGIGKYVTANVFILFLLLQLVSIFLFIVLERPLNYWIRRKVIFTR